MARPQGLCEGLTHTDTCDKLSGDDPGTTYEDVGGVHVSMITPSSIRFCGKSEA